MTNAVQVSIVHRGFYDNLISLKIPIDIDFEDSTKKSILLHNWRLEENVPLSYPLLRAQITALKGCYPLFKITEMSLVKNKNGTFVALLLDKFQDPEEVIHEIQQIFLTVIRYQV